MAVKKKLTELELIDEFYKKYKYYSKEDIFKKCSVQLKLAVINLCEANCSPGKSGKFTS